MGFINAAMVIATFVNALLVHHSEAYTSVMMMIYHSHIYKSHLRVRLNSRIRISSI